MKLKPIVNSTNILQAAFAPIISYQKIQSPTVSRNKLDKTILFTLRKMLIKLTPTCKKVGVPPNRDLSED